MANDTLWVLGGLALLMFFASSGSDTVAEIEENVMDMGEIHNEWNTKHKEHIITHLMAEFLSRTANIRNLEDSKIRNMSKRELVGFIKELVNGPPQILRKLYNSVRGSELKDELRAKEFCDSGFMALSLLQHLFESVYQLLPRENKESAEVFTDEMNNTLQAINTFSI